MTDQKIPDAKSLMASDKELQEHKDKMDKLYAKWMQLASDDSLKATVKALEAYGNKVSVVNTKAEACKIISELAADKETISSGGSTTLAEIGFAELLKTQTKWRDFKAESLAAIAKNDMKAALEARRLGLGADWFFTSCGAISEKGDMIWGSATGTRLSPTACKNLVVVAGTNKIVKTYEDCVARLYEWQWPIESARARLQMKVPASSLNEVGSFRGGPMLRMPGRMHVVLVKEVLGF